MSFSKGELVTRISYKHDLLFRVASIHQEKVKLHGEDFRLEADAPAKDLVKVEGRELEKRRKKEIEKEEFSYRLFRQDYKLMKEKRDYQSTDGYKYEESYFQLPAKVLHLDGDQTYLKKCIELYQRMGLHIHGVHVHEKDMPHQIGDLVKKIQPDIIVITGHDSYSENKGAKRDLHAYRHSKYFTEAVREARNINPHMDQLIIFAGACQSHFESLIRAGANFASSPLRVNIHALDPVYVAARIAYTPFMEKVNVWETLRNTLTGTKGMGGVETRGILRTGLPYIDDNLENY
ncbi:sporulation peptidase YabG [Virgibacillus halodenitrificans]|jgi:spore coat assemly protein|uniref:Sporulation peptidase YabG n=1 Tax=Virgibacillus halodenitrificans TaxID=1482 RepID=A0AAC9ITV7_VIRHA|nr:sporulation peptidase YabG [Virgibacillus halodenitrificans]APC46746.1 sporulation peptidase YabG [Virgibacillus halodenitrificans]MBD1222247.1 sporulation peptidase YabG [Virgibacillus halodenitrificans]MCG1030319.1 sporulation peptidase YabG [Virgibacillus halodenitrificans]MCJ0931635.1 sporulation peptidase YabG [Virgibacillus halodenitrificans]MEC2157542.1 sporulation peptidase YabG [Virgibacillus halodenitrificans]